MLGRRTVLGILLASVVAVLLVGAGVAAFAYHRLYRPAMAFHATVARTGVGIANHRKEFLDDQAYAAGLPFFAPRKGAHDAGPVIGRRIHWVLVKPGTIEYRALSDDAIDRGLYDKLGDDWLNAPPEQWSGLDFGWMARARAAGLLGSRAE